MKSFRLGRYQVSFAPFFSYVKAGNCIKEEDDTFHGFVLYDYDEYNNLIRSTLYMDIGSGFVEWTEYEYM